MLTITKQAAQLIAELLNGSALPEGAGLRLAQRDHHPALALSLRQQPEAGDLVLLDRDVAVFLGPIAAYRTQHQSLDADAAFYLRD